MNIKQITDTIEELAPLAYAEDFDNVGLLIGNYNTEVTGILVTLDTLEKTVDEAITKNCNLIVSFHPIIFSGLKKLNGNTYVERVVMKAIKNDIAIYAIHTALDSSHQGVSAKMCEIIGLTNTKILLPQSRNIKKLTTYVPHKNAENLRNSLFTAGAGNIGNYNHCSFNIEGTGTYQGNENSNPLIGKKEKLHKEPETFISVIFERHLESQILKSLFKNHPYEEVAYDIVTLDNKHQNIGMGMIGELTHEMEALDFLHLLKEKFNLHTIRYSDLNNKKIKKVAVLGGSGSFAINQAKRADADIFITADMKYHDFYKAENQIILADIGHYESEQFTKNLLVDYLTKKITNFAPALLTGRIILSEKNTNPINYI
ncbi:MAG: Nif3-like dinuclear metal center hexameric protein [Flavobacteriaceae bacterium]|nr:Nif3-like dinuclear metal center hexameric protein [Flavobacteriaceae bacterium]